MTVEDTYWDRVHELASSLNLLFLGFMPRHRDKSKTKIKLFCREHDIYWETTNISNFLNRKTNPCKVCKKVKIVNAHAEPEPELKNRLSQALEKVSAEFVKWDETYHGVTTKFTLKCNLHNEYLSGTNPRGVLEARYKTSGCKSCKLEGFKGSIKNNEDKHISDFMNTGKFHPETTFCKDEGRKTKSGVCNFWKVVCGKCKEEYTSFVGSLKNGSIGCSCNPNTLKSEEFRTNQILEICDKEGYEFLSIVGEFTNINSKFEWICMHGEVCTSYISNFVTHGHRCSCNGQGYDKSKSGNLYLVRWYGCGESYIKFGITNREVQKRIDEQDSESKLDYEILHTFHHESGQRVWDCEKLIKQNLNTGVCSKELMPDGYTETVVDTPENLQQMLDIIKEHLC